MDTADDNGDIQYLQTFDLNCYSICRLPLNLEARTVAVSMTSMRLEFAASTCEHFSHPWHRLRRHQRQLEAAKDLSYRDVIKFL